MRPKENDSQPTMLFAWDNAIFVLAKNAGEARELAAKRFAAEMPSLLKKIAEPPVVYQYPKVVVAWHSTNHQSADGGKLNG